MRVGLILLLVAVLNSGCFIFEEIEEGRKIMAAHSPNGPEIGSAASEKAEKPQSPRERLAEYYAEQRAKAKARAEKQADADPGDAVGRCRLRGSTQFTRRSDCELRGGTFL